MWRFNQSHSIKLKFISWHQPSPCLVPFQLFVKNWKNLQHYILINDHVKTWLLCPYTVALIKEHALPNWNETSQDGYIFTHSQKSIHHSIRAEQRLSRYVCPKPFVAFKMFQLFIQRKLTKMAMNEDSAIDLTTWFLWASHLWHNYNLITQRQGRGNGSLQWYYSSTIRSWSKSLTTCLFIYFLLSGAALFAIRWEDLVSRIEKKLWEELIIMHFEGKKCFDDILFFF